MKFFISLLMIGMLACLSGCNTMEGAGKDIQEAGDEIEDAAK